MKSNNKLKVVAVVGPTGSGKTELGVKIAQKYNGLIISADSRQVYRGLDVGTNKEGSSDQYLGKPSRIIDDIRQLLVDISMPGERFTLNDWLVEAKKELNDAFKSNKTPIIVGGTGLYVSALLQGYLLGEGQFSKKRQKVSFDSLVLMMDVDRKKLYEKSDRRCEKIFDKLLAETKKQIEMGVSTDWFEKLGLDYRYATLNIKGELNYNEAIKQLQKASRNYIRRQLTWWRHHGEVSSVVSEKHALELVGNFLRSDRKLVE